MNDIYPCVIFADRYGGIYSGGKWVALYRKDIPKQCFGDDGTNLTFWADYNEPYGIGDSPNEALENLTTYLSTLKIFQ